MKAAICNTLFISAKVMFVSSLLLLSAVKGFGQSTSVRMLRQQFEQYSHTNLQEKIFVHTDRSAYLAGETLWFKLYVTDGILHKPLALSKVAYIELLDIKNTPVLQASIALQEGSGQGSFFLPAGMNAGYYTLRAYTHYMKNTDPAYFFTQKITVVNTFVKPELVQTKDTLMADVQFFPEGGHLVHGLPAKVAFKVNDPTGKGLAFTGFILNQQYDTVAHLKPLVFGMGHFTFTPLTGESYMAIVHTAKGKTYTQQLPAVQQEGIAMQLQDLQTSIRVSVSATPGITGGASQKVYLLVHTRQLTTHTLASELSQGSAVFEIDKAILDEGISHITLFNERGRPVCERLYFKQPQALLQLQAQSEDSVYQSRNKVTVHIDTKAASGQVIPASMSVSVFRIDSLQHTMGSLPAYLWLSSDLQGYVESPEFYLDPANNLAAAAADNLMLTQGWRRFSWNTLFNEKASTLRYIPEYNGAFVEGRLLHKQTQKPAAGILMHLAAPGKRTRLYGAVSDAEGRLRFELDDVYGLQDLIVQPAALKDSMYRFERTSPFVVRATTDTLSHFYLSPKLKEELQAQSLYLQVQHAHYANRLNRFTPIVTDSLPFYGHGDFTYHLDEYNRFRVMEEVLREYVSPVVVRRRRGKFALKVYDSTNKTLFEEPLVLLDGLPVTDHDKIMAYDPLKVKTIDVLIHPYTLGVMRFDGIINFKTYEGDMQGFTLDPAALVIAHDGLQQEREFYAPRYDTQEQRVNRMPDLRNLLYWNPNVTTGTDGRVELDFYTSDQQGRFMFVCHGLTAKGLAGSSTFVFTVKGSL